MDSPSFAVWAGAVVATPKAVIAASNTMLFRRVFIVGAPPAMSWPRVILGIISLLRVRGPRLGGLPACTSLSILRVPGNAKAHLRVLALETRIAWRWRLV